MIKLHVLGATQTIQGVNCIFKQQKHGVFIQMASGLGMLSCPKESIYSATKAYLISLLTAVGEESRAHGAKFVAACPFWVATQMTILRTKHLCVTPDVFVKSLMRADWSGTTCNPCVWHKVFEIVMRALGEKTRLRKQNERMTNVKA